MTEAKLPDLIRRIQAEGVRTEKLTDWRNKGLLAILLGTESGANYVIEPITGEPSRVTRLSETPPFHGEFRMPPTEAIIRRQGNPDTELEVGKQVNILGLPRKGTELDPDSLYTTTPLVEIKYLEAEHH